LYSSSVTSDVWALPNGKPLAARRARAASDADWDSVWCGAVVRRCTAGGDTSLKVALEVASPCVSTPEDGMLSGDGMVPGDGREEAPHW
jgi:hypothetical protein